MDEYSGASAAGEGVTAGTGTGDAVAPVAPVAERERIGALDTARGFALLGIFFVNIQLFGEPFATYSETAPPRSEGIGEVAAFYFVKIFCEGKFYPLFSMMFGIGLVLQMERITGGREGVGFRWLYLRRLLVLAAIGLCHALFLWYGDILLMYSLAGLVLLLAARLRPVTLVTTACVLVGAGVALMTGLGALQAAGASSAEEKQGAAEMAGAAPAGETGQGEPASGMETGAGSGDAVSSAAAPPAAGKAPVATAPLPPFNRLMRAIGDGEVPPDPNTPAWRQAETEAYRDGGYWQATGFRAVTFGFMLVIMVLGFGWHVVAMFFVGAALAKWGVFAPERRAWQRRFLTVGALVGLPLSVLAALLPTWMSSGPEGESAAGWGIVLATPMFMVGGPLLSLAYLGGVTMLVNSGAAKGLTRAIACVGRMGLTNYLLETVIATFVMYHWGLRMFGETTRVERVGIVLGVYAVLVAVSVLWLRVFRFGPVEWVWRTLTYLRAQPMLKR